MPSWSASVSTRQRPRTAVIIVNYRTPTLTAALVDELLTNHAGDGTRVIVVDNSAGDPGDLHRVLAARGASDRAEQGRDGRLTVIRSPRNLGFSGGVNAGAATAGDCEYLWVLNSDARPLPGALEALLDVAEHGPAVVGSALYDDGGVQSLGGTRSVEVGLIRHRSSPRGSGNPYPAPWVHGASFLVRTAVWQQLGGFREDMFLYFEETDLCYRARRLGFEVYVAPASRVEHQGSASVRAGSLQLARDAYLSRNFLVFLFGNTGRVRALMTAIVWGVGLALTRVLRRQPDRARAHLHGVALFVRGAMGPIPSVATP